MTSTRKIVLWVLGGLFALTILVVVAAYIWWRNNGEAMVAQGRVTVEAGRTFGDSATAHRCVDELFARHPADSASIGRAITGSLFFRGCLDSASALDSLCTASSDTTRRGLNRWVAQLCVERGRRDPYCGAMMQPLAEACHNRRRVSVQG